jgi:hypothetical protein
MADSMEFICTDLDAEECRADMEQKECAEQKMETEAQRIFRWEAKTDFRNDKSVNDG